MPPFIVSVIADIPPVANELLFLLLSLVLLASQPLLEPIRLWFVSVTAVTSVPAIVDIHTLAGFPIFVSTCAIAGILLLIATGFVVSYVSGILLVAALLLLTFCIC